MILIEENFLSKESCDFLQNLSLKNSGQNVEPFRDIFVLYVNSESLKIANKLGYVYCNFLASKGHVNFPEMIQITRWPVNSQQKMHFDTARDTTVMTSITYLNDDYEGGETCFDNGLVVKPLKGKTIFFDGMKYKHCVNPVQKKERHVLAIWYSNNANNLYTEIMDNLF